MLSVHHRSFVVVVACGAAACVASRPAAPPRPASEDQLRFRVDAVDTKLPYDDAIGYERPPNGRRERVRTALTMRESAAR